MIVQPELLFQIIGEQTVTNRQLRMQLESVAAPSADAEPQSLATQTEDGEVVLPTEEWEETR